MESYARKWKLSGENYAFYGENIVGGEPYTQACTCIEAYAKQRALTAA